MLLDLALEVGRRDVLAAGGDDDVLFAAGDRDEAVGVDRAEVAGVEPAVDDRLPGRLVVLVVALEDVGALDQDLAVLGDLDLAAREGFADRADLEVVGRGDRRRGRRLGHPPALEHEHPGGVEEAQDVGADRRRAGDREAQLAAEEAADLREHFPVGELVLLAQQEAGLASGAFGLAHLAADPDRPVEDRLFEAALFFHAAGRERVDLLEDPRHRGEVGRFQFGQVGHDLQRVALPVGDRRAEVEAAQLDQQGEGVGEGEVEVGDVFAFDHARVVDHVEHRSVVAVGDHAALRRPGRPRRVDEGADVLRGDRLPEPLPLGGVTARRRARTDPRSEIASSLAPVIRTTCSSSGSCSRMARIFSSCSSSSTTTTLASEFSSTYWHSSGELVW